MTTTADDRRVQWQNYLETTETYGTYEQRKPEYDLVARTLVTFGMTPKDSVLDVGAGTQDFARFLRENRFEGEYVPIDGSIDGTELNAWESDDSHMVDWVVCIETLEHVHDPRRLFEQLSKVASKGVVVTTPNSAIVDTLGVDPTHVVCLFEGDLQEWGMQTFQAEFSGRGDGFEKDTLVGVLRKKFTKVDQ